MSVRLTSIAGEVRLVSVASDFLEAFGHVVRQLRQERGMTQAELAARLSLGRTSITNLEKGQQSPPLSALPEIASALGVDPLRLIANAVRVGGSAKAGSLEATVHDKDLRRWAGQVIGDTLTGHPSDGRSEPPRERRPA
jgi:transcriptional regulator with XRE-family HTH domain